MQAKYVIISQYWKKVVVKSNALWRLPSRLQRLLDGIDMIHLLPPICLFPPLRSFDSYTLLKMFAMWFHACKTLSKHLSLPISLRLEQKRSLYSSYNLLSFHQPGNHRLIACVSFMSVCPLLVIDICSGSCFKNYFTNSIPLGCP